MNAIAPNSIPKINNGENSFKLMENIARFAQAARAYGLSDSETFQTVDLYEKMNLHQVILCLFALGRKVRTKKKSLKSNKSFLLSRHKNKAFAVSVQKKAIETNEIFLKRLSLKVIQSLVLNMVTTKVQHNPVLSLANHVMYNIRN